jgi:hypothetical protein
LRKSRGQSREQQPQVPSGPKRLGWREWVELPGLGVRAIKAKLDTGARTSSLHAFSLHRFARDGVDVVRFEIHPVQRSHAATVQVEANVLGERRVRTSSGQEETRIVIETTLGIAGERWPIELTLTRRDEMGFRMLLGRQAMAKRIVVDPSASFLSGRPAPGSAKASSGSARAGTNKEEE